MVVATRINTIKRIEDEDGESRIAIFHPRFVFFVLRVLLRKESYLRRGTESAEIYHFPNSPLRDLGDLRGANSKSSLFDLVSTEAADA